MRARWLALVAILFCAGAGARPQSDRPQFSTHTDVVVLHVTVKDPHGGYVTGLTKDAFSIIEGGQPQSISFFAAEDASGAMMNLSRLSNLITMIVRA